MTTTVIGLDLSLTSTGVARIVWSAGTAPVADVWRIKPKATGHERLRLILDLVGEATANAHLVVLEGPSFGSPAAAQRGHHERAGLWWMVKHDLWISGFTVAVVPPTSLKAYITGKGTANKDEVLVAVTRTFADVTVAGNDEADALVLAAMGADHLGTPIAKLPAAQRKAAAKVEWPPVGPAPAGGGPGDGAPDAAAPAGAVHPLLPILDQIGVDNPIALIESGRVATFGPADGVR